MSPRELLRQMGKIISGLATETAESDRPEEAPEEEEFLGIGA